MNELVQLDPARTKSFCTFRLGSRLYGIDVAHVREVSPHLPMTTLPQAPPAIRGLFNLRSRIYLGLDVSPLLGLSSTIPTAESRLIILKPSVAQDIGVLVEQGGAIVHARADLMEAAGPVAETGEASWLIAEVYKLPAELMMVVDVSRMLEAATNLLR